MKTVNQHPHGTQQLHAVWSGTSGLTMHWAIGRRTSYLDGTAIVAGKMASLRNRGR